MRIITDFAKIILAGTLIVNVVTLPVYAKGESAPVQEQISVQPVVLSEEETDIINTVPEDTPTDEDITVQEQPVTEDVTVSDNPESEEVSGTEGGIMLLDTEESSSKSTQIIAGYLDSAEPLAEDTEIVIRSSADLILLSNVKPNVYQKCVLKIVNSDTLYDTTDSLVFNGNTYTFQGLAGEYNNTEYPFSGKVFFTEGNKDAQFTLIKPLFNLLSTDAKIIDNQNSEVSIVIINGNVANTSLLADKVKKGTENASWMVTIQSSGSESITTNPPVIGNIESDCNVTLSVIDNSGLSASGSGDTGYLCGILSGNLTLSTLTRSEKINVSSSNVSSSKGNAGGLVGSMGSGSSLKVDGSVILNFGEIATNNGNAGGLVGMADSGATINVLSGSLNVTSVTATSGSAGGIAGEATDLKTSSIPAITIPTITGDNAGGLFGSYTYTGTDGALNTVTNNLSDMTLTGNKNVGGVFGVLKNNSEKDFSISNVVNIIGMTTDSAGGNAGGLIGRYTSSSLKSSLTLSSTSVTSKLSASSNTYGGLIGWVSGDNASYIETTGTVTVTTSGTTSYFGGLIGILTDSGHMLKVADVKANACKGTDSAGGLVGNMPSGVLWLAGNVDTKVDTNSNYANRGWIVGQRGNTLVYNTYSYTDGWSFNKNSCNDIGNWGQVVQVLGNLDGLVSFDTSNHIVTICDPTVANTIGEINSASDFAAIALRIQLEQNSALIIPNDITDTDLAGNEPIELNMNADVDLSATGLTSFQRDYNSATVIKNITLNGNNHSITLPDLTIYGGNSHNRQGLFAKTDGLTVSNLVLRDVRSDGSSDTCGIRLNSNVNNSYAGALVAHSSGEVELANVKSHVNIYVTSNNTAMISGLIAFQDGGSVTYKNCSWDSAIVYNGSGDCYIGGLLARTNHAVQITVTDNCSIGGSIEKTGGSTNYSGGLISSLIDTTGSEWDSNLVINGLTADGVSIISPESATTSGGILGWEWMTKTTEISGITVKNCSLNTKNARFGGLIYKGSGYWKVDKDTNNIGIKLQGSNSFSGVSGESNPSGLLLAQGIKQKGNNKTAVHYNALYLEIINGAYVIDQNPTINIGSSTCFDEIIGQTIDPDGDNGIVSIGTESEKIDQDANPNTYVNTISTYINPNTRYYYNLDRFRENNTLSDNNIDNAGKMVLLSAYDHCFSQLKKYFLSDVGKITGNIDLTGYSFYPLESFHKIENASITFDYEGLELKENGNKQPSDSTKQHYGMHTGIFTGIIETAGSLTVNHLTLKGTVGGKGANYGALIRDGASGKGSTEMMTITLNSITLDNVKVIGTNDIKPLLINSLGSYTTLTIDGISMSNYTEYGQAASSLIGNVGNEEGTNIHLSFSNIDLKGKKSESIFSHATLLESFQYRNASTCRGTYNFKKEDSHTVGKELSNFSSGRNQGKQYWFYQAEKTKENLVCGENNEPSTFFVETDEYLRYVYKEENGNYHELDINLSSDSLEGCGTHSDPYIIKDGEQLKNFAAILSNGTPGISPITWTIKMDDKVLESTFDQETAKNGNYHECSTYTTTSTGWKKEGTESDDSKATAANVAAYLRNAYYLIDGNINMPDSGWAGLGTSSQPFSGVIVGSNNATINIPQTASETQYGGLIKYSQGSVVKDLTINYEGSPTVSTDSKNYNIPSNTDTASFFGGVIGWCVGGDTIIDGVTVTYSISEPVINGTTNPHLTAVGGYVGIVGGAIMSTPDMSTTVNTLKYGGGVVFRGDIGNGLNDDKAQNSSNFFYVNPYVGRVLDGYVLSESQPLDNTDKNYTIPTISSDTTHLSITDNTVTVQDAQGLWLLSAIANSGAGSMGNINDLAYTVGKARIGTYNNVGDTLNGSDKDDERYLGGKSYNSKTGSYLSRFVTGDIYNLCNNTIDIIIGTDCDMSGFGNGFRGIGTSYGTNVNSNSNYRLLKIQSIDGAKNDENYAVITLAQDRKEYTEEKNTWTSIGSGLFILLQVPNNGSFKAANLSLSGTTGITYYTGTTLANKTNSILSNSKKMITNDRISYVGSGMFASNIAKEGTINKMELTKINLVGSDDTQRVIVNHDGPGTTFTGGLIGCLWNDGTIKDVILMDCMCNCLTVNGRLDTGGLIGYIKANNASVSSSSTVSYTDLQVTSNQVITDQYVGIGGLVGLSTSCKLMIGNDSSSINMKLQGISIVSENNTNNNDRFNVGGLVGALMLPSGGDAGWVKNVSIQGAIDICGGAYGGSNSQSGGIIGSIYDSKDNWNANSKTILFCADNVNIATEDQSSLNLYNSRQAGGLIGMIKSKQSDNNTDTIVLRNITLGRVAQSSAEETAQYNVQIINNCTAKSYSDPTVGGIIGIVGISPIIRMEDINIENAVMLSHDNNGSAGIVFGHCDTNYDATTSIFMKNVKIERCGAVVDRDSAYAGIVYGRLNQNKHLITGVNILVKDCFVGVSLQNSNKTSRKELYSNNSIPQLEKIGLKNSSGYKSYESISNAENYTTYTNNNYIGIWGGNGNNNKTIQLVGVSLQQSSNTLPMKEFGSSPNSNSYIVRADYTGVQDVTTNGAYPYVTTNPISTLGTLTTNDVEEQSTTFTVTGDGAAFYNDKQAIGSKILADLNEAGRLNLKYSAVSDAKTYIESLSSTSGTSYWEMSNFDVAGENTFTLENQDFPVLVLTSTSSTDINNMIYSWISLLTNCPLYASGNVQKAKAGFPSIKATSYRWNNGKFEISPEQTLSVTDKQIKLKTGYYDNQKGQFTLIDAEFSDPTGGSNAYHLYVPVIIKKTLKFRFWAAGLTGTTYNKSSYETLNSLALASNGEKITVLFGYEYGRTKEEWQAVVDNGEKLLGNFKKQIVLKGGLPDGTKLTLVDCNNQNKSYTSTYEKAKEEDVSTGKNYLNFEQFKDSSQNKWDPVYLCDLLTLESSPETSTDSGEYIKCTSDEATLRITNSDAKGGYDYYKYVSNEDKASYSEETFYNISVKDKTKTEQYYLTIQTPYGDTSVYNNFIECPSRLKVDGNFAMPTQWESYSAGSKYAKNGVENRIVFGNCFKQEVSIDSTSNNVISSSNRRIVATLKATVSFLDDDAKDRYKDFADSQNLYQCFELKMKNGEQQVNLARGTVITAEYMLNGTSKGSVTYTLNESKGSVQLVFPMGIDKNTIQNFGDTPLELTANIILDYTDAAIIDQFPTNEKDEANVGIQLWATSKLAFKTENLPYSTISQDTIENKYYYRKEFKTANLNYNTTGDVVYLGINGKDGDSFTVNSRAIYNVSAIEQAANAKTLRYNLTLWRRNNGSGSDAIYEQINTNWLQTYLKHEDTDPGLRTEAHYVSKDSSTHQAIRNGSESNGVYTVDIDLVNGLNKDVPIQIPVDLKVLTGSAFEAEGKQFTYANYKVQMEAFLLDGKGEVINGTIASDYIIYTNAKINYNYLKQPSGTQQSE